MRATKAYLAVTEFEAKALACREEQRAKRDLQRKSLANRVRRELRWAASEWPNLASALAHDARRTMEGVRA